MDHRYVEGEQNIHVPCAGSELHAAPSAPQIFSSFSPSPLPASSLPDENPSRGEGAVSEWRTTDICPERWKPPDLPCGEGAAIERRATEACRPDPRKPSDPYEVLQESRGALLALGEL